MHIVTVQPRLPPVRWATGDFCQILADRLIDFDGSHVTPITTDSTHAEVWQKERPDIFVSDINSVGKAIDTIEELKGSASGIILQYQQYDYHPQGMIWRMVNDLVKWKKTGSHRKLIISVHELWLPGLARRREAWLWPLQMCVHKKLFNSADCAVVVCQNFIKKINKLAPRLTCRLMPVFSNFGEPNITWEQHQNRDHSHWVIFGSEGRIWAALNSFNKSRNKLPESIRPTSLSVFGGGVSSDRIKQYLYNFSDIKTKIHSYISIQEASQILAQAGSAWVDYEEDTDPLSTKLFKSGIFSACLAHGLLVGLVQSPAMLEVGGESVPGVLKSAPNISEKPLAVWKKLAWDNMGWYHRNASVSKTIECYKNALV